MIKLSRRTTEPLWVLPKWPAKFVFISPPAYSRLNQANNELAAYSINLVLTRGFEQETALTRSIHRSLRRAGMLLFTLVYPSRSREAPEIFSANGHDHRGDSIDVSVVSNGQLINLLPYGVFTSPSEADRTRARFALVLGQVESALNKAGFDIHQNKIESLQIHCELRFGQL